MMITGKIGFAIIGLGHIGKRHALMIQQNPHCELLAVIDSDKNVLDAFFASGTTRIAAFSDIESFLCSGIHADVCCVCTPNGYHVTHAMLALEASMHVVVEKPFALNYADALSIIDLAGKKSKFVFNVMQNRFSPPIQWLKETIDSGKLGNILFVQINCFWNRDERYYSKGSWHGNAKLDGGTLFTQFSHFIDILYWIFGDVENIQSQIKNINHPYLGAFDDSGAASFTFKKGGFGALSFTTNAYKNNLESSITIMGEKGTIKIGGQYMDTLEVCNIDHFNCPDLPATAPGNDYGTYKGSAQNHGYIYEDVVRTLKQNNTQLIDPQDGAMVVNIIERIYRAAK
ncbi:Gfo/Idh/MocA family protein [Polluticaenibacter yanchengensis]|uniref:Gfo/Idh/MocA family oxidoreductase n=1 Tax=Polluticaenibacter yanchengensis TaxID=3014562 RepID=A0ABT4UEL7_9BACT|nr:Gfo/Idh/MocA family oxidoreductase [Chitinophagaceae bacterium LY-5]